MLISNIHITSYSMQLQQWQKSAADVTVHAIEVGWLHIIKTEVK